MGHAATVAESPARGERPEREDPPFVPSSPADLGSATLSVRG